MIKLTQVILDAGIGTKTVRPVGDMYVNPRNVAAVMDEFGTTKIHLAGLDFAYHVKESLDEVIGLISNEERINNS